MPFPATHNARPAPKECLEETGEHAEPDIAPPALVVDLVVDTVTRNSTYIDIRICGELDIATHDVLLDGLSGVEFDERSVVRLHLAGLTFCDAHGGCLILDYVDQTRRRGHAVSIENPTPAVHKLLGLLETWIAITAATTSRDRESTPHTMQDTTAPSCG